MQGSLETLQVSAANPISAKQFLLHATATGSCDWPPRSCRSVRGPSQQLSIVPRAAGCMLFEERSSRQRYRLLACPEYQSPSIHAPDYLEIGNGAI